MQRRFYCDELQAFLRLIDAELNRPCAAVLVGGAALSLGYCPLLPASELELWTCSDDRIWTAVERANAKIPRPIRVHQAFAGEPRYAFEDRAWPVEIPGLRFLSVRVPQAEDHVLLKAARAEPMESLTSLQREHPLSLPTLIERYYEFKGQMTGPRQRFVASFLDAVEKLFGNAAATELGERISVKLQRGPCAADDHGAKRQSGSRKGKAT